MTEGVVGFGHIRNILIDLDHHDTRAVRAKLQNLAGDQ
jgi:hypothetical protein